MAFDAADASVLNTLVLMRRVTFVSVVRNIPTGGLIIYPSGSVTVSMRETLVLVSVMVLSVPSLELTVPWKEPSS